MLKLASCFAFTFFIFSSTNADEKNGTLILDFEQAIKPDACNPRENWIVKNLNNVYSFSSEIPDYYRKYYSIEAVSKHSREFCGFPSASCKIRHLNVSKNFLHSWIWYQKPFPTVYSKNFTNLHRKIYYSDIYNLKFIPINLGIDTKSYILDIEKSFIDRKDDYHYQFFDVIIRDDINGKALCRVFVRKSNLTFPDRCIVTRYKYMNRYYVLGLVERKPYSLSTSCPTSRSAEVLIPYYFEKTENINFVSHLLRSLKNTNLKFDSNEIDIEGNLKSGIYLFISVGPRISPIDKKFREKLDISLRFVPSEDYIVISNTNLVDVVYRAKLQLSAWIGRQDTDPSGTWRMPKEQYYNELESRIINAVDSAFNATCKERNKESMIIQAEADFFLYHRFRKCS